jgi:hypothetical protein
MGAFVVKWLHPVVANKVQPIPWKALEPASSHLGYSSVDNVSARIFDPNVSSVSGPGAGSRADHWPPDRHQRAADRA